MKPLADSLQHAVSVYQFPESSEVIAILELGLNQAVAGNVAAPAALNDMADKIHGVMTKYGYQTAKLPALR